MYLNLSSLAASAFFLVSTAGAAAQAPAEVNQLPQSPTISPDGETIAFEWQSDIWSASIEGGEATRLTYYAGRDSAPVFSANGKELYFTSARSGRSQIHVMPAAGGPARQITFDSNRKAIRDVASDGRHLLITQSTDRGWHYSESVSYTHLTLPTKA